MGKSKPKTPGEQQAQSLNDAIRDAELAPLPGARELPLLDGLYRTGGFRQPVENVLAKAKDLIVATKRLFKYGDSVVMETLGLAGAGLQLAPLRTAASVEAGASDLLANIILGKEGDHQFPLPKPFVEQLLRSEVFVAGLPTISTYSRRPVFDDEFILCGPGWHPESGIMVHGPEVDPVPLPAVPNPDHAIPALDRLPPHLRTLLSGFCFKSDADVANTVGVLVTGMLMNHFVVEGKPVLLVDGNQPGLGKTLLVRVIGIVIDGIEPEATGFTNDDEELQKRLCALLRKPSQSVLLIDNAKVRGGGKINSPVIEAQSMAVDVSLRILGKSENLSRPNDLLWALTMNDTRVSPDLVSRGLVVQLAYEGRPEARNFDGPDPRQYAREHRVQILGELAGLIQTWNQGGRQQGTQPHRLRHWAQSVGGIMAANGFSEFLANASEAAAAFDSELDLLAALAEAAVSQNTGGGARNASAGSAGQRFQTEPKTPREWCPLLEQTKVLEQELRDCASTRAKEIRVGKFLSPKVGRNVPIQCGEVQGLATLCVKSGRSRQKLYSFDVEWDHGTAQHNGRDLKREADRSAGLTPVPNSARQVRQPERQPTDRLAASAPPQRAASKSGNSETWD